MKELPAPFIQRLEKIVPRENLASCLKSFSAKKVPCFRVNTLKVQPSEIASLLKKNNIEASFADWYQDAIILKDVSSKTLDEFDLIKKGFLYRQSLSSMLIPLILAPAPQERVLDLCAAPGSKTTQIASLMKDRGKIIAVENVRGRFYKLKSVVTLLGASIVEPKLMDARKYRNREGFDRILVDAPCSCEGRFKTYDQKTFSFWSLRKIKEMRQKQRGILLNASRLLKDKGVLVYSTCTFAPEENEGVVDWLLRKTNHALRVEPVGLKNVKTYPPITEWEGRTFDSQVRRSLRILPTEQWEGFFVAKFIKDV